MDGFPGKEYADAACVGVVQTIGFRGLLGWAFGPRDFMKNGGAGASACQLLIERERLAGGSACPTRLPPYEREWGFGTAGLI